MGELKLIVIHEGYMVHGMVIDGEPCFLAREVLRAVAEPKGGKLV